MYVLTGLCDLRGCWYPRSAIRARPHRRRLRSCSNSIPRLILFPATIPLDCCRLWARIARCGEELTPTELMQLAQVQQSMRLEGERGPIIIVTGFRWQNLWPPK